MIKSNFIKLHLRWLVPVMAGFMTLIVCLLAYRSIHKPISPGVIQEAKMLGVSPVQLNDINQLDNKMYDKRTVTVAEWERYKSYATGSNLVFKRKVARHLSFAMGSSHEQEAHDIARALIRDVDPETRANALIPMRKFEDPNWRDIARRFLSDPDKAPRKMGATMLQQDSRKP